MSKDLRTQPLRPILTLVCLAGGLLAALLLGVQSRATGPYATVRGVVLGVDGPLANAIVQVRATDHVTRTAANGAFTLTHLAPGVSLPVTAWFDGYYVAQREVVPPATGVTLTLRPYPTTDNPDYAWMFPRRADSPPDVDFGCDDCHAEVVVAQWQGNAHARSARSPRFLSMYNGTDVTGTAVTSPGYKLDFPGTSGNCANCHGPGAAVDAPFSTDMNALTPPESDGVFCDFCHKIARVYLDPVTGLPYPNMPGVLSYQMRRPPEGQELFFGPYADVPEPDTYLPVITRSQFCAPCHSFSFWGVPIYTSYPEWLASPYARQDVQCQTCHMAPDPDVDHFVAPEKGGYIRDPMTIPSHKQPGAGDVELLQHTVQMDVSAEQVGGLLAVTVTITNTGAGHHVPTGSPIRHMILTVVVTDEEGRTIPLRGGSRTPSWAGAQAGLPGKVYGKVLQDVSTGETPVASYWKPTRIVSDTRIPALGVDRTVYLFALPAGESEIYIRSRLIFRPLFADLIERKGWLAPDILMAQKEVRQTVHVFRVLLPLLLLSHRDGAP